MLQLYLGIHRSTWLLFPSDKHLEGLRRHLERQRAIALACDGDFRE